MNKKTFPVLMLLGLGFVSTTGWPQTRELGETGELLDGIAAVVDNGVVLRSEFNERLTLTMNALRQIQLQTLPEQRRPMPPLSILEEQVLEQLILRQIQLQRAQRFGIIVSDELLNQALSGVANEADLTLEDLPAALAEEGINYAMYRQDTREQLILDQLQQRDVVARIVIAPREVKLCLSRTAEKASDQIDYNISHILIGLPSSATDSQVSEARQRVDQLYAKLEAGEEFSQLAILYSESQTALDGGALGWRKGIQLPTLFASEIIEMNADDVSDPIQSASGFHIVRLNDLRGAEAITVDQIRVRHVLLRPNEILDGAAVLQKLTGIRNQIIAGDDFVTVAQAVSEDPVSAADGGDLGWVGPGTFVPEFEQRLAALELGELSEPFQTRFGWHIAEITDRRSYDTTEEMKELRCAEQIRGSKLEEERELWLRRLRDEAFVETFI
ncbi:MAG: peptidylprolyl isomerase [Gammaproteobacteria bacterium]